MDLSTRGGSTAAAKPKSNQQIAEIAQRYIEKSFRNSCIPDKTKEYPKFEDQEVQVGKVLGKGGFGTVSEVRAFSVEQASQVKKLRKGEEDPVAPDGMENKAFIAQHCIRNGGDARYAIKRLSPEVVQDPDWFLQGILDMAVEVRLLGAIEHPHIVKLRGMSTVDWYHEGFMLLMDRLYDTLAVRLVKWRKLNKRTKGLAGRFSDRKGNKTKELMEERLVSGTHLSAAFEHLHSRKILYRDIKPENIGFDVRGDIKVFDFGLAKEVHENLSDGNGCYNLTAMTGTPRYMAPEVALSKPYNETCDVVRAHLTFFRVPLLSFSLYLQ